MRQSASVITLLVGSAAAAAYKLADSTITAQGYGAGFYAGTGTTSNTGQKIPQALRYSDPGLYTSLTDRQAAYAPYLTWNSVAYTSTAAASTEFKMTTSTPKATPYALAGAAASGGSGCPQCLLGGGVWCSRTYAYQVTAAGQQYQWEQWPGSSATTTDGATYWFKGQPSDAANALAGGSDFGACCQGKTTSGAGKAFSSLMGGFGVASAATVNTLTGSDTSFQTPLVAGACPAIADTISMSGSTLAADEWKAGFNTSATARQTWWCSNGLYHRVGASDQYSNVVQPMAPFQNPRAELALVGCPQRSEVCGAGKDSSAKAMFQDLDASSPAPTWTFTLAQSGGFAPAKDKCTWIGRAYAAAPGFYMDVASGGSGVGLSVPGYVVHSMEFYTASAAWDPAVGALRAEGGTAGAALEVQSATLAGVPLFDMPAAQFASLRTWYGQSTTQGQAASVTNANNGPQSMTSFPKNAAWYSPAWRLAQAASTWKNTFRGTLDGVAGQVYGNVASLSCGTAGSLTVSTAADLAGKSVTAGSCYGSVDVGGTAAYYDFRQMRYVPASVAQDARAYGASVASSYSSAVNSYTTAKTAWDAYVALLDKNAKMDAFAAFFAPPKAPTVPPLPSRPWSPPAYAGLLKMTPEATQTWAGKTAYAAGAGQPAAGAWWYSLDAAQSAGGWGAFTAQLFAYRTRWGKSFGTLGYEGTVGCTVSTTTGLADVSTEAKKTACAPLAKAQVWNQKWMCTSSSDTASATSACAATYPAGSTAANASGTGVQFVSVVSLWALGDLSGGSALTWGASDDFQLVWVKGTWGSTLPGLTAAVTFASQPAAASSLTGIAGAQALAASAAAALAAAAALY